MKILICAIVGFFVIETKAEILKFPEGFQWCVATAGHQVEGDNIHSDWWEFEQKPGTIKNGDRSGKASFHMERLEEDVQHMKEMNVKTYRFSIEWSRIEPQQGVYDEKAIAYYHRELDLLKASGIKPMVTLHHFVSPQWFAARGGWTKPDAVDLFFKYAQKIESEYGSKVEYWITFNEPMVQLIGGYGEGFFAPGEKKWELWDPLQHILKAHALTYHYFHKMAQAQNRSVKIGIAHHLRPLMAQSWWVKQLIRLPDHLLNWNVPMSLKTGIVTGVRWKTFLGLRIPWIETKTIEGLENTQDYLGINYYTREVIDVTTTAPYYKREMLADLPFSELNWSIDPEGFYEVFKEAHRRFAEIPFFVTENGLADSKDQWRKDYLLSHLKSVYKAINEIPHKIEGYCHWSLMDNFEWQEGYAPRFGLIEVDYANRGERKWRPSAYLAKEIFGSNELRLEPVTPTK